MAMTTKKDKHKFFNPNFSTLEPYVPGKQINDSEYLKLNTNENPFGPSPRVKETIIKFLEKSESLLRLYPEPESDSLREVIAKKFSIKSNQVFIGNGSDEVLSLCFLSFFAGRGCLSFPELTYSFYPSIAKLFKIPFSTFQLKKDFFLDLTNIDRNSQSVIFPNPNAITGIALPVDEIDRFVKENPDKLIIIDEAYADFSKGSCVSLINNYPNILVIQTFSKSRGMAGLRVGFCFGSHTLIDGLRAVKNSFNSYPVDALASLAAISAINDDVWFEDNIDNIVETRSYFSQELKKIGFRVLPSSANFVLVTHPSYKADILKNHLFKNKILVRQFPETRVSNWLRITIGKREECDLLLSILKQKISEAN
ncbi:aminotransferase class I/II-fold pyridoxal phosphate-dependent enzyme [Betaproteobacteria bacterium]|nr:aminotransferase class I/II-fold pyridoxal phosphate-dependent enzyme [Betaproteobacteria bacterium]